MKLLSPDAIRRCFIADPGKLIISADFDQIELRIAAGLSREPKMIAAAKAGESLHKLAAVILFGPDYTPDQYRYTKNVNFGWLFGGGAYTLAEQAGIPYDQAKWIITKYEHDFAALSGYRKRMQEQLIRGALSANEYTALRNLRSQMFSYRADTKSGAKAIKGIKKEIGKLTYRRIGWVTTPYGRRLPVDVDKAYRVVNYVVQSTARDVMAEALLRVMDDPELEPTALLPIHDEILGQAPIDKAERIAERYGEVMSTEFMGVPLTATGKVYGRSWGHGYMA